jgi:hypothetical protein
MNIPNTGDRFDPFDIHVERFIEIIKNHIREYYGEPDQAWLATVWRAREEQSRRDGTKYEAPDVDFAYFKNAVFKPSVKGIGRRGRIGQHDDEAGSGARSVAFMKARLLVTYYDIDTTEIVGTSEPSRFATEQYTRWPYYAAALALVVEQARSIPHEVHVVPDRTDDLDDNDLQQDPLVYAVQSPRRERGEGDHDAHREGEGDVDELADAAHPQGRSASRRQRRWSSTSRRTTDSSSSSSAGVAGRRKR